MKVVSNLFRKQAFLTMILVLTIVAITMFSSYALYFKVDPIAIAMAQSTKNLRIVYGNNGYDQQIKITDLASYTDEEAIKSKDIKEYKLFITNNSNHNVRSKIYLKDVSSNESIFAEKTNQKLLDKNYIKFQINDQINVLGNQSDGQILVHTIKPGAENVAELTIKVWVDDTVKGNILDQAIHLKFVVTEIPQNIYGEEASIVNTIINQEGGIVSIEQKEQPDYKLTAIDNGGLYVTEDDFGNSYYYRGSVTNNHVVFGTSFSDENLVWRIVRINGDGSVRLILSEENLLKFPELKTIYNIANISNGFVGFMYGNLTGKTVDIVQNNENTSNARNKLDTWFISNFADKYYKDYLVDQIFCSDRSIVSGAGVGRDLTFYGAYDRLDITSYKFIPSMKCLNSNDRYTISKEIGNGTLNYAIGLLTADEAVFAGATNNVKNSLFYLKM